MLLFQLSQVVFGNVVKHGAHSIQQKFQKNLEQSQIQVHVV